MKLKGPYMMLAEIYGMKRGGYEDWLQNDDREDYGENNRPLKDRKRTFGRLHRMC